MTILLSYLSFERQSHETDSRLRYSFHRENNFLFFQSCYSLFCNVHLTLGLESHAMISMIGFNFQCFQSKQNKVNFEQFPRFSLYLFSIKDSIKFLMDSNACTASNEKNIHIT